jgi:hypothetical protein
MASKNRSHKKAGSKPATAAAAAPTTAARGKKERKPRKPPLARAVRIGGLLAKQHNALKRNVAAWKGAATAPEQRLALTKIKGEIAKLDATIDTITSSLAFLEQTKYEPKVEHLGGRTKSFGIGAPVALKEKRYDAEIHGPVNTYNVTGETAKGHYLLKSTGKPAIVLGVPRSWLEKRDGAAAPAAAPVAKPAPKGATPEVEPDAGEDEEDENPGLSPEG